MKKGVESIIDELQEMMLADQTMRQKGMRNVDEWDVTIDHNNTKRLEEIIDQIGWPTISKVGKEASSNAWLLAQHADHDLDFQRTCLALMKQAPKHDVASHDIAYLEDRIAVAEGRPQTYGTQFFRNTMGELIPRPIANREHIDVLRSSMKLEPFDQYQERLRISDNSKSA